MLQNHKAQRSQTPLQQQQPTAGSRALSVSTGSNKHMDTQSCTPACSGGVNMRQDAAKAPAITKLLLRKAIAVVNHAPGGQHRSPRQGGTHPQPVQPHSLRLQPGPHHRHHTTPPNRSIRTGRTGLHPNRTAPQQP
jgi:hypothetical protein